MSLLPQTILPATEPIGKANADGTVAITKNWWLLIYNLCQQVLGTGTDSGGGVESIALTGSPFTYQAPANGTVTVIGGLISALSIQRGTVQIDVGISAQIFPVSRLDLISVTYSEAPTMQFLPR